MSDDGTGSSIRRVLAGLALVCTLGAGCSGTDTERGSSTSAPGTGTAETPIVDVGDGGAYAPVIDPADFVASIDNPYLPLRPGSRWVFEGTKDGETERTEVVVTTESKTVLDVATTVVHDTVWVAGELAEDTVDWFAQDRAGNVWYFGEDSKEYEDGEVVSTAGSWEAGVDGAKPGIVMPADPGVGAAYRQEYYAGEAEDMAEVVRTDDTVTVPAGTYTEVLVTKEWTPLEPDVVEEKAYAPGVGQVRGETVAGGEGVVELTEFTRG